MSDDAPKTAEVSVTVEEMLSGTARPRFGMPPTACIYAVSVALSEDGDPVFAQDRLLEDDVEGREDVGEGGLLRRVEEAIPARARIMKRLPDRPPQTQAMDWGLILGSVAAIWQLVGLPGVVDLGLRLRAWLRARGRSGDVGAVLPIALSHLIGQYPDANPDMARVQYFNPLATQEYPMEHQVVYVYRFYDVGGRYVYLLEVDSFGECVTCVRRQIQMFESAGDHAEEG